MALRVPIGAAAVPSRLAVARQPNHGGSFVGDLGRLGRHLLGDSRWTDDPQPGVPFNVGGPQSLFDELKAFDPRTRAGLVNLATMFVPGGKGGKVPAWQLKTPADLGTSLAKAGMQPSSWITRPDPALEALGQTLGNKQQRGVARDPDSAMLFYRRRGLAQQIGPRMVGGIYRSAYSGEAYRVLDIQATPNGSFRIKVEPVEKNAPYSTGPHWHGTAWDWGKDQVLMQPPGLTPSAETYLSQLLRQRYDPNIHGPGG